MKVKWWEKWFHENSYEKKAWVDIQISDKLDFKSHKSYKKHRRTLYIKKRLNIERSIVSVSIYVPNNRKHTRQTLNRNENKQFY